jgi:hypothetical protein
MHNVRRNVLAVARMQTALRTIGRRRLTPVCSANSPIRPPLPIQYRQDTQQTLLTQVFLFPLFSTWR